ncbi:hypothetical protein QBC38DRAFT_465130 [Podospora fimiseda]|uniref:Uncharacterized protein n=1 Tax=Podospora fimiseda TaxID=252190 RepID=A0AAN7BYN7_9PEZI|nr:hypothetical protein QBC38DRAFT_465130 [Podospora fimiseda]
MILIVTMSYPRAEEISRNAEHHLEQYIKSLRALHEIHIIPGSPKRPASNEWPASPATFLRSNTFSLSPEQRTRRPTNESPRSRPFLLQDSESDGSFLPLTPPSCPPLKTTETHPSLVLNPLPQESFSEEDLLKHIKSIPETNTDTITALGDLIQKRNDFDLSNLLTSFEHGKDSYYKNATYQFYEVNSSGLVKQKHPIHAPGTSSEDPDNHDTSVWSVLREVNTDGTAVGRISILQEPSPLILSAIHKTLSAHFDTDELFSHLVSTTHNKGKTKSYMLHRCIESSPIRQRSFFFVFKYYTIIADSSDDHHYLPAPWQPFDPRPSDRKSPDHIDITECSSVLALSLGGVPKSTVEVIVKKKKRTGVLYDTFGSWHLLNIQYCADDHHSSRTEFEKQKVFRNGPHAFLDALCVEYRDAVKRYMGLNEMITKLITPPNQFMFDVRLRDKLLFEDSHFTYSRRYFWAYNTLGVINEGIRSMSTAYLNTFTKDFWAGKHPTLFPISDPDCDSEYLGILNSLKQELDSIIAELKLMYDKNEATRTEIRSLREQLFSGSSVKESRRAIEQGDNIKILTSVSMIFLPLTFVVSIFSITTIDIKISDPRFAITVISVCIPFFLLILLLQTRASMVLARKIGRGFINFFGGAWWTSNSHGIGERRGNYHYYNTSHSHHHHHGLGIISDGQSQIGERRNWFKISGIKWNKWLKRHRQKGKDQVSKMEEGEAGGGHEHVS